MNKENGDIMKIYYKDEDDLSKLFCELMNCEGEQPTESDPTGCTGCDASEEWINEKYSEHMIDEVDFKEFISKDELFHWIDSELKFEKTQKKQRNKGYFDALHKLKFLIVKPKIEDKTKGTP